MPFTLAYGRGFGRVASQIPCANAADIEQSLTRGAPIVRAGLTRTELEHAKAREGWYSCATYKGERRAKDEIAEPIAVLSFDVDSGTLPDLSAFSGLIIETATSSEEAPRWRVHLDLAEPVPAAAYTALCEQFGALFGVPFDEQAKDPSRLWYRRVQRVAERLGGEPFDWRLLFGELTSAAAPELRISDAAPLTDERKRAIVDMVSSIWADDAMDSREAWIKAGMAIHASTGGHPWGLALWDRLSQRSDKYNDGKESCAGNWHTFKSRGALATLESMYAGLSADVSEFPDVALPTTKASEIAPRKVKWLWSGYLACGFLHLLAGPPGVGKSQASVALAAIISAGHKWPDGTHATSADVLIHSTEDDRDVTIVPRLIAAGANLDRVHFLDDRAALAMAIRVLRPRLVILDPLTSGLTDQNDQAAVRAQLEPFAALARDTGAAFVGLSHFAKRSSDLPVLERVLGSTSFSAIARVVLAMADGDDGPVFAAVKNNLAPLAAPWSYCISAESLPGGIETSKIEWGRQLSETAEKALTKTNTKTRDERNAAQTFLLEFLESGPKPAAEVKDAAEGNGFTSRRIDRAKEELKGLVKSVRVGDHWEWALETKSTALETLLGVDSSV